MFTQKEIPKTIWIHSILIMAIGLVALFSASYNNVRIGQAVFYDQLGCALASLIVMFVLSHLDYRRFYDWSYALYIISVVFLAAVLLLGREALGATRWFSIGSFSFQPSEFSKLAVVLFLGRYLSQRRPQLSFDLTSTVNTLWVNVLLPLFYVGISVLLIFKQPDLGTAILIFGIFLIMLFLSGLPIRIFWGLIGILAAIMPFAWHVLKPYQRDRLLVFLNPDHDPLGAGYTIAQSKIAIGSGQLFGKGWLAGTQNQLNFLPERHTDFIFSVIGEEWGFLGGLVLIYAYAMLIFCGFRIAEHNKDPFGRLVVLGIVSILTLQVVINVGMVMGLLPVVGITLPMVSYGRTSFMVFAVMVGFLLNLSRHRTIF